MTHGALLALIAIGPLMALVFLAVRTWHLGAFTDDGTLSVRNWFSTHNFRRNSVRGFRIGGSALGGGQNAIQVLITEGASMPISASIRPWYLVTADQQGRWLEGLEGWRRAGVADVGQEGRIAPIQ